MILGLIPAAGRSRRMGRPKLALMLGGKTVLEHVLTALASAGVQPVLLVVGPQLPELAATAEASGSLVLRLAHETPDMRATVEQGLDWFEQRFHPGAADDVLLVPADHPLLDADVVCRLLNVRRQAPPGALILPTFQGVRGHPLLFGWDHVAGIRNLPEGLGINAYLKQHAAVLHEVAVPSASVLEDLDTPEDYERLLRQWPAR